MPKIESRPWIQTDIPSICSWSYADRAQDYQQLRVQASTKTKIGKNLQKNNGTSSCRLRSQDHDQEKKMNSKNKIDEKIIMYAAEVVTISQQHIATAASGY